MKKIIVVFVLFAAQFLFAQQTVVLNQNQTLNVRCERGLVMETARAGIRDTTLSCVRACVLTLKTKKAPNGGCNGGVGYCTETIYPSGTIADTCGNLECNRDLAIEQLEEYAQRELSIGSCDKVIKNY